MKKLQHPRFQSQATPTTMQSCHSHSRQMKPDGDRTCRHAHVAEEMRVKKRDIFTACASGVCVII